MTYTVFDMVMSCLFGIWIGSVFGFLIAGLMWGTDNDDVFD